MEKLIELLNEYRREKGERNLNEFEVSQTLDSLNYLRLFIQWLVENEKIDINEEWEDYRETNLFCNADFFQLQQHYSYYESLLMLLSIQNNPIEFLISILK